MNGTSPTYWNANGIQVSPPVDINHNVNPSIISDGVGGTIISWLGNGIHAQRVNELGNLLWSDSGIVIADSQYDQSIPVITTDGSNGAIIAWSDPRNGNQDVFAQNLLDVGTLGGISFNILSVSDVPNDQGGYVRIKWNRCPNDVRGADNQIVSYGIWRKIPPGTSAKRSIHTKPFFPMDDSLGLFYDFITSVPAIQSTQYNVISPTFTDSCKSGIHRCTFVVTAHTSDPNLFYISNEDSGYSIDNLFPASPLNPEAFAFTGGSIKLVWNKDRVDPDLEEYAIYRSTTTGFSISTENRLATLQDTIFVDTSITNNITYYYRLTSIDIHGNESAPSPELSATVTVYVSDNQSTIPTRFAVMQNYPNPFNPSTSITYDLPSESHFTLSVYNILGQQVAVLAQGTKQAGTYSATWSPANVTSGLYIYKLEATSTANPTRSFMQVRKMILMK